MVVRNFKNKKSKISLIIRSLIEMIRSPKAEFLNNPYFYHSYEKKVFLIYLYLFKLFINDITFLESKYMLFKEKFKTNKEIDIKRVTNILCDDVIDLLRKIKVKKVLCEFDYDEVLNEIIFEDGSYVDANWFLTFMSLLLDNVKDSGAKEINICYTIPNKDIIKVTDKNDKEKFLEEFIYYSINIRKIDKSVGVRENNILVVKNAAINYLKHLKQYKHGLEGEESYKIFYNLLLNECKKYGFECYEKTTNLRQVDENLLCKIDEYLDDEFYSYGLSRQVHIIENLVWQSSNDITLVEYMGKSIDMLVDFLDILYLNRKVSYCLLKEKYHLLDLRLLLVLITSQFLITYYNNVDDIDYSLLNLANVKPKYMNRICRFQEQELKGRLRSLNIELVASKKDLEMFKKERERLNKNILGEEKYKKELEDCVSNINRVSIVIARINSKIASILKEYEDLKKEQSKKYRNVDLYNYNHSIIRHICNSILGCNFYLKTNNLQAVVSNIIIFEDYERTDNSFYLEISFKDLLKISNQFMLKGIMDQNDLPKLA